MSNETIPVPTEMLVRLKDSIRRRTNDGWVEEAEITGPIVRELLALIPAPRPKVGDKLNEAQIKALPTHSVMVDADGDIYVKRADEYVVSIEQSGSGNTVVDETAWADDAANYGATLVWIPEEEK